MAEVPIRKYIDAKKELDDAMKKVIKLQSIIGEVGNGLRNPYEFMVSNVNVGFPVEVAMGRVPTLNANEWPSAQQIAELLDSLHKAYHNAQDAYLAMPELDRKNVVPLPERY